jgi:dihydroorotate dehydrogenase electron transfer subunit
VIALIGAASARQLYWEPPEGLECEVRFATEDGSLGVRGLVTDLLEGALAQERECAVYACGPLRMLRRVSEICSGAGVLCQVSVEAVFACGMGLCRGCAVPSKSQDRPYLMACSDGPVLDGRAIEWERFAE